MTAAAHPFVPRDKASHPAPVPGASQLIALPFLSALAGYLHDRGATETTRVVLHRTLSRQGGEYLQQISAYAGICYDPSTAGRMSAVTTGIIGRAYALKQVIRTRLYPDNARFMADLKADMESTKDDRDIDRVARSFLAVPMLSRTGAVVAVLYADTFSVNTFADDTVLDAMLEMSREFCKLVDALVEHPLPGIQNYELMPGRPVEEAPTVYPRLQEVVGDKAVPRFDLISSLNFEASA